MRYPELLLLRSIRWWFVFSTAYKLSVHLAFLALGCIAMLIVAPRLNITLTSDGYAAIAQIYNATTQEERNNLIAIVITLFIGEQIGGILWALWPERSK